MKRCCNRGHLILLVVAGFPIALSAAERPNVLFISVDDMNDWVGCLGGYPAGVQTPNIDRLARRGTLFTAAYCPSPKCCPSRTAILTGMMPHRTGIYDNNHWLRPYRPDIVTMPAHFMAHGYHVAGAGKVFHHTAGFNPPDQWHEYFSQVFDDPWDRVDLSDYSAESRPMPPASVPLNGIQPPRHEFDWGSLDKDESQYGDSLAVAWASEFLKRPREKPFFLAIGLFHPHLPWYAPRPYFDRYPRDSIRLPTVPNDDLDDVPAIGLKLAASGRDDFETVKRTNQWPAAVQAYLASISFADAQVGRLLDALDASPYAERTIIVFWSDHGWHLGEKQHWHKSTLWERATHVPLAIVAPGVAKAETRCERTVSLVDLYRTLGELCDLPAKDDLDGTSLVPLLRNPQMAWDRPALMTYQRGNHAVRNERWRYIRYADGGEELYDHRSDPNEWANLATKPEHTNVKRELARWLPSEDAPTAPPKSAYQFDPKTYTWRAR